MSTYFMPGPGMQIFMGPGVSPGQNYLPDEVARQFVKESGLRKFDTVPKKVIESYLETMGLSRGLASDVAMVLRNVYGLTPTFDENVDSRWSGSLLEELQSVLDGEPLPPVVEQDEQDEQDVIWDLVQDEFNQSEDEEYDLALAFLSEMSAEDIFDIAWFSEQVDEDGLDALWECVSSGRPDLAEGIIKVWDSPARLPFMSEDVRNLFERQRIPSLASVKTGTTPLSHADIAGRARTYAAMQGIDRSERRKAKQPGLLQRAGQKLLKVGARAKDAVSRPAAEPAKGGFLGKLATGARNIARKAVDVAKRHMPATTKVAKGVAEKPKVLKPAHAAATSGEISAKPAAAMRTAHAAPSGAASPKVSVKKSALMPSGKDVAARLRKASSAAQSRAVQAKEKPRAVAPKETPKKKAGPAAFSPFVKGLQQKAREAAKAREQARAKPAEPKPEKKPAFKPRSASAQTRRTVLPKPEKGKGKFQDKMAARRAEAQKRTAVKPEKASKKIKLTGVAKAAGEAGQKQLAARMRKNIKNVKAKEKRKSFKLSKKSPMANLARAVKASKKTTAEPPKEEPKPKKMMKLGKKIAPKDLQARMRKNVKNVKAREKRKSFKLSKKTPFEQVEPGFSGGLLEELQWALGESFPAPFVDYTEPKILTERELVWRLVQQEFNQSEDEEYDVALAVLSEMSAEDIVDIAWFAEQIGEHGVNVLQECCDHGRPGMAEDVIRVWANPSRLPFMAEDVQGLFEGPLGMARARRAAARAGKPPVEIDPHKLPDKALAQAGNRASSAARQITRWGGSTDAATLQGKSRADQPVGPGEGRASRFQRAGMKAVDALGRAKSALGQAAGWAGKKLGQAAGATARGAGHLAGQAVTGYHQGVAAAKQSAQAPAAQPQAAASTAEKPATATPPTPAGEPAKAPVAAMTQGGGTSVHQKPGLLRKVLGGAWKIGKGVVGGALRGGWDAAKEMLPASTKVASGVASGVTSPRKAAMAGATAGGGTAPAGSTTASGTITAKEPTAQAPATSGGRRTDVASPAEKSAATTAQSTKTGKKKGARSGASSETWTASGRSGGSMADHMARARKELMSELRSILGEGYPELGSTPYSPAGDPKEGPLKAKKFLTPHMLSSGGETTQDIRMFTGADERKANRNKKLAKVNAMMGKLSDAAEAAGKKPCAMYVNLWRDLQRDQIRYS